MPKNSRRRMCRTCKKVTLHVKEAQGAGCLAALLGQFAAWVCSECGA